MEILRSVLLENRKKRILLLDDEPAVVRSLARIINQFHRDWELEAVTDPEGANKDWAEIDKAVMEKAPWVPLFNPKHVDFTSARVANFQFSNQFYWLIANSWVK